MHRILIDVPHGDEPAIEWAAELARDEWVLGTANPGHSMFVRPKEPTLVATVRSSRTGWHITVRREDRT